MKDAKTGTTPSVFATATEEMKRIYDAYLFFEEDDIAFRKFWDREVEPMAVLVKPTKDALDIIAAEFIAQYVIPQGGRALHVFQSEDAASRRNADAAISLLPIVRTDEVPDEGADADIRVVMRLFDELNDQIDARDSALYDYIESNEGKFLVVIDDFNLAPPGKTSDLIQSIKALCPQAHFLGLSSRSTYTGTESPMGLHSDDSWQIFDFVPNKQLQDQGYLSVLSVESISTGIPPLSDDEVEQYNNGELNRNTILDRLVTSAKRNQKVADIYLANRSEYGRTIMFVDDSEQAEEIASHFKGIPHECYFPSVTLVPGFLPHPFVDPAFPNSFVTGETPLLLMSMDVSFLFFLPETQTVIISRQVESHDLMVQMSEYCLLGERIHGTPTAKIIQICDPWPDTIPWAESFEYMCNGWNGEDAHRRLPPLGSMAQDDVNRA